MLLARHVARELRLDRRQRLQDGGLVPRLVLLARLKAFRAAHAHEPFAVVRQCFDMPKHLAGAEHLTRQLADALRVPNIANVSDTKDESLRAALVHVRKPDKSKITQVVVPVFATILVKKLVEDTDGIVSLVATFIQRPLLYDLKSMDRESGNEAKVYFDMRVNEGEHFDCFTMRKVAHVLEAAPGAAEVKKGADAEVTQLGDPRKLTSHSCSWRATGTSENPVRFVRRELGRELPSTGLCQRVTLRPLAATLFLDDIQMKRIGPHSGAELHVPVHVQTTRWASFGVFLTPSYH